MVYLDEDIYMVQPEGFVDPNHPRKVCKLQRSIYGLKQASRSWKKDLTRNQKDSRLIEMTLSLRHDMFSFVNGRRSDWKSSKQMTTAMSATELKYIASSEAAMEAVMFRKFNLRAWYCTNDKMKP
ncbi:reverse transcriptase [Tanacetum coccineum]